MDIKFTVLLYSKYSSFSKKLIEMMQLSDINFAQLLKLREVCTDNENIRKRLKNDKKLNIQSVPCILVTYDDGVVEKYEDILAFNYIEEIINKYTPPPPPPPQPVQKVLHEEVVEDEEEYQPPPPRKQKQKQVVPKKKQETKKYTTIDDLEDLEDLEEPNNDVDNVDKPKDALSAKRNDLVSLAASMQKQRESIDASFPKQDLSDIGRM